MSSFHVQLYGLYIFLYRVNKIYYIYSVYIIYILDYILCIASMPLSFLWIYTRLWWCDMYIMCSVCITSFPLQYFPLTPFQKQFPWIILLMLLFFVLDESDVVHHQRAPDGTFWYQHHHILRGGPAALGPEARAPLPPPPAALHPRPRPPAVGPQQLLF